MAVNFKIKKIFGFFIAGLIPIMFFLVFLFQSTNLFVAIIAGMIGLIGSVVVGLALVRHPLLEMIEGSGVLVLGISSAGVIQPYIAKVRLPHLFLKTGGKRHDSIYNRTIGMYLRNPKRAVLRDEGSVLKLELPKEDFSRTYFRMGNFPVLIWNDKLKTFLTKEMLGELETNVMVEHLSLLMLDQAKRLRESIRLLIRHAADQFAPSRFGEFLRNPFVIALVVIIVIVIAIIMFAPMLPKTLGFITEASNTLTGLPVS